MSQIKDMAGRVINVRDLVYVGRHDSVNVVKEFTKVMVRLSNDGLYYGNDILVLDGNTVDQWRDRLLGTSRIMSELEKVDKFLSTVDDPKVKTKTRIILAVNDTTNPTVVTRHFVEVASASHGAEVTRKFIDENPGCIIIPRHMNIDLIRRKVSSKAPGGSHASWSCSEIRNLISHAATFDWAVSPRSAEIILNKVKKMIYNKELRW